MGIKIIVEGFDKRGVSTGKAQRVLKRARSKGYVMDNVDHLKGAIKIGQCGTHVVTLDDGQKQMQRTDKGRRGTVPPRVGVFEELGASQMAAE